MQAKFHEKLTVGLFCGFLAVMMVLYLVLPKATFSEREKRQLSEMPLLNWENLSSGQFGSDMETYMADHMPGRNFFVGLGAYYDLLSGRQVSKDIYLAENGRLVEAPAVWNQAQIDKNMKYIQKFANNLEIPVDLMIVPSAGFMLQDQILGLHDAYLDDQIIENIYAIAEDGQIGTVDLLTAFRQDGSVETLYYRTDHHWTSYGAYRAYHTYLRHLGQTPVGANIFYVEAKPGFLGSTYSRSALWLTESETLDLWYGSQLTVTIGETTYDSPFFQDRLQEADMYTVFLDGNQPLVRIRNEANVGKGKLLVIRDSYSNCLGPMLAESFEEVVMIDLRYYKLSASQLCAQEGFTNVLVAYSLSNFMTDSNFPFLR